MSMRPSGEHRHLDPLARRADRRLDVVRESDAAQPAVRARRGAAFVEAVPFGEFQRALHVAREFAAVVGEAHRAAIRQLVVRDEVAAADLGAVDAEFGRGEIEHPLDHVRRLGAARAAIRRGRHRVRQHRADVHRGDRHVVDGRHDPRAVRHRHIRHRMRADVADPFVVDGENAAVFREAERGAHDLVAALIVGQERLAAVAGPLDRAADATRGPHDRELLDVDERARAEAAAGIGADHAHLRRRHLQRAGEAQLLAHRALAAGDQRVHAGCAVVCADRAARLHLAVDDPAVVELAPHRRAARRR